MGGGIGIFSPRLRNGLAEVRPMAPTMAQEQGFSGRKSRRMKGL
ncbi:MAG: hypothetical protein OXU61_05830 [Gammaproteobacteria bacterium]|nr:hypothetical protein [Gammaproteobacteria bacterium]